MLSLAPLIAIAALVVLAWFADWGRAPERRAILVVGVLGALLGLGINVAIGHFYFRPRPFLTLSDIHSLLPKKADSSLYSDRLCIAGALTRREFDQALSGAGLVDIEISETHRVHDQAAAAVIRATKPGAA